MSEWKEFYKTVRPFCKNPNPSKQGLGEFYAVKPLPVQGLPVRSWGEDCASPLR